MAEISCKHCGSLDCRGCNIYRLEQMLDAGKFDALMNENRVILISADVCPVRHGRWIVERDDYFGFKSVEIKCSECNSHPKDDEMTSFCPACGADMREVQDDD